MRAPATEIVPGSDRKLTFGGRSSFAVPPGAPALSDPLGTKLSYRKLILGAQVLGATNEASRAWSAPKLTRTMRERQNVTATGPSAPAKDRLASRRSKRGTLPRAGRDVTRDQRAGGER